MSFLATLGLRADATKASIRTRLNHNPLGWETKNSEVGTGHWKLGVELEKKDTNYQWNTWTVEDGCHVINFSCTITPSGKLVDGTVNLFALGFMDLDQGYIDDLLEEYKDDPPQWESIE